MTFQRCSTVDDGYGNEVSGHWEDEFTVSANIAAALGREEVLAQRPQAAFAWRELTSCEGLLLARGEPYPKFRNRAQSGPSFKPLYVTL